MIATIGITMKVEPGKPLVAGEARSHGMSVVRAQADELVALDFGKESAARLTHTAEGGDLGHDESLVWREGRRHRSGRALSM